MNGNAFGLKESGRVTIPPVEPDQDTLLAARAYAGSGMYLGPVRHRTKHPGSLLGDDWPSRSTRDPEVIEGWFARTDHGIFLHCGRSRLVVFDVDRPEKIHPLLRKAIDELLPPYQTTRVDDTERGHYLFAVPRGRKLGNSLGSLGSGWGEIRGKNGVIIVAPSAHEKDTGRYVWQRVGPVPVLPDYLSELLPEAGETAKSVTDAEVENFLDKHQKANRPELLAVHCASFRKAVAAGESRHDSMTGRLSGAMKEAAAEFIDARLAADTLESLFFEAVTAAPVSDKQKDARSPAEAKNEWRGLLAWAVAQAKLADPADTRARVSDRVPADFSAVGDDDSDTSRFDKVHRGQARMAYRLADDNAGKLLHVHGLGWHTWDGQRWAEDQRGVAVRAVLSVLRRAMADSVGLAKFEQAQLISDVRKCESDSGIRGVLSIAAQLLPFAATVADMDADPYPLNCANGTLDLHTLTLHPHDPAHRITKVTRAAYRPGLPIEGRWRSFLERVLPDQDVRAFLARYVGQGLVGRVLEHSLVFLTGTGRNGKGVFYGAVAWALGDYATVAEPDLFMHREGAHPTGEMDLRGRRWVAVSENDKDRKLAEATVKRLTGGDIIKARHMRKDFVEFEPSHTAVLVTNHLPRVSGDDPALWARLRVVPFNVVLPTEEQNPHLPEELQLEADSILSWAVAGWRAYQERGMGEPPAVVAATDRYHTASDDIARFIEEECLPDKDARTPVGDLYSRWETWCYADRQAKLISQRAFGNEMVRRGFALSKDGHGKRFRDGIALQARDES